MQHLEKTKLEGCLGGKPSWFGANGGRQLHIAVSLAWSRHGFCRSGKGVMTNSANVCESFLLPAHGDSPQTA